MKKVKPTILLIAGILVATLGWLFHRIIVSLFESPLKFITNPLLRNVVLFIILLVIVIIIFKMCNRKTKGIFGGIIK